MQPSSTALGSGSMSTVVASLTRQRDSLEQEVAALKRDLKDESRERDLLDQKTSDQERKIRQLERKIADIQDQLQHESSERDALERLAGDADRAKRQLEMQVAQMSRNVTSLQIESNKFRDDRLALKKRMDEQRIANEKELDDLRDQLRKEKRTVKEYQFKLDEEKDDARTQLSRVQNQLKRENNRLAQKLDMVETEAKSLRAQVRASTLTTAASDPRKALEQALKEKIDLETQKSALSVENTQLKEQLLEVQAVNATISEEKKNADLQIKALAEQIEEEKMKLVKFEQSFKQMETDLAEANTIRTTLLQDNAAKESKIIQELKQNIVDLEKEKKDISDTAQHLDDQLTECHEQLEHDQQQIQGMTDQIAEWQQKVIEANVSLTELNDEKRHMELLLQETEQQLTQKVAELETIKNSKHTDSTAESIPSSALEEIQNLQNALRTSGTLAQQRNDLIQEELAKEKLATELLLQKNDALHQQIVELESSQSESQKFRERCESLGAELDRTNTLVCTLQDRCNSLELQSQELISTSENQKQTIQQLQVLNKQYEEDTKSFTQKLLDTEQQQLSLQTCIDNLTITKAELERTNKTKSQLLIEAEKSAEIAKTTIASLERDLDTALAKVLETQQAHRKVSEDLRNTNLKVVAQHTKIISLEKDVTAKVQEMEVERLAHQKTRNELKEITTAFASLKKQNSSAEEKIVELEEAAAAQTLQLETLTNQVKDAAQMHKDSNAANLTIKRLEGEVTQMKQELQDATSKHEQETVRFKSTLGQLEENLRQSQAKVEDINSESLKRMAEIQSLTSTNSSLQETISGLRSQLRSLNSQLAAKASEVMLLQENLSEHKLQRESSSANDMALQNNFNKLQDQNIELNKQLSELTQSLHEVESESRNAKQQNESLISQLKQELQISVGQNTQLSTSNNTLKKELAQTHQKVQDLEEELELHKDALSHLKNTIAQNAQKIALLTSEKESDSNQYDALESKWLSYKSSMEQKLSNETQAKISAEANSKKLLLQIDDLSNQIKTCKETAHSEMEDLKDKSDLEIKKLRLQIDTLQLQLSSAKEAVSSNTESMDSQLKDSLSREAQQRAEINTLRANMETAYSEQKLQISKLQQQLDSQISEHEKQLAQMQQEQEKKLHLLQQQYESQTMQLKQQKDQQLLQMKQQNEQEISIFRQAATILENQNVKLKEQYEAQVSQLQQRLAISSSQIKQCEGEVSQLKQKLADTAQRPTNEDNQIQKREMELLKQQLATSKAASELEAADLKNQIQDMKKELSTVKSNISPATSVETERLKKEVDLLRSEKQELLHRIVVSESAAAIPQVAQTKNPETAEEPSGEMSVLDAALSSAKVHPLSTIRRPGKKPHPVAPNASAPVSSPIPAVVPGPVATVAPQSRLLEMDAVSVLPKGVTAQSLVKKLASTSTAPKEEKRGKLIQLKGRRRIRSLVVDTAAKSLNSGDVFLFDVGDRIFQWNGSKCNRLERSKGVDLTNKINRTRGGRAKVITLDEGDNDNPETFNFWKELGGRKEDVQSAEAGGDDADYEAKADEMNKLFLVGEDGQLEQVEGKLVVEKLSPSECYILDCFGEIYVFIGKTSPSGRRNDALSAANNILNSERASRPPCCEVVRCNQGGESVLFCEKFANWPENLNTQVQASVSRIPASKPQGKINIENLLLLEPPEKQRDVDRGDGTIEVWVVSGSGKDPVDSSQYGQFFSQHSYVILYTYGDISDRSYILYFWQGADSTPTDSGTSAALALNMSKRYKGASQIRVPQHGEQSHFCKIFKGCIIVHRGPQRRAFSGMHMYHVRGQDMTNTTIIEIEPNGHALNSRDVFIVINSTPTTSSAWIWKGQLASSFCSEVANVAVAKLLPGVTSNTVSEESETEEFWAAIGGKPDQYGKSLEVARQRLFLFSTRTGNLSVEPQWIFSQYDLRSDIMGLLDAWNVVFLWCGAKSKPTDRKFGLETAMDYAQYVQGMEPDRGKVEVLSVNEGEEPITFTSCFHAWRYSAPALATKPGPYQTAIKASTSTTSSPTLRTRTSVSASEALQEFHKTYTYAQLQDRNKLPPTVDKSKLETYLSDEEFQIVFKMTKAEWDKVEAWKKPQKKKDANLF